MSPAPAVKRNYSQLDQVLLPSKKHKSDAYQNSFSFMSDQAVVGAPGPLDFTSSFEELVSSVAGIKEPSFDPLFDDTPLDMPPLQEASDVSSDESKHEKNEEQEHEQEQIPLSPFSSSGEGSEEKDNNGGRKSSTPKDEDSQKKRLADRAARNRESSRRAREKQKNRFRALESGYVALQETAQRYKLQIEHLHSLLERAQVVQQSCPVCSYNSTLVPHAARKD